MSICSGPQSRKTGLNRERSGIFPRFRLKFLNLRFPLPYTAVAS